jgi:phenylacetate-CoA ligase
LIIRTPLEQWVRQKIQIDPHSQGAIFGEELRRYQVRRLNETIDHARRNAPFYRDRFASLPDVPLATLTDLAAFPFTSPTDLTLDPFRFLAVRQDDVAKIVTLRTSGSTGEPKRIFFSEDDLELTMDFFHHGMSTLVRPGQRVAILLPGQTPDSVGDLLYRGLVRMDVESLVYGPITDASHAAHAIASFGADCLVGIPTQVLAVARSSPGMEIGRGRIESILLTTDYVPQAIAEKLREVWGCRVFNHYGMTEMGLGGGVECATLDGYHLREADLLFEVVDHETGEVCPDGVVGEVVFTTLTRRGMPLIRYRTGDISRIITLPCPCGSVLRRMERVKGRWDNRVALGPGNVLILSDLDEALFRLPGLLDYRANVSRGSAGRLHLHVDVYSESTRAPAGTEVLQTLTMVESIRRGLDLKLLDVPTVSFSDVGRWVTTGVSKRKILNLADDV